MSTCTCGRELPHVIGDYCTITAHCYWAPKCRHTETGTVPEVNKRMERHYQAKHKESNS